jgi:poly-gamma-glutamate synthesis protein (capsule biosynthesis protein)
VSTLRVGLAGDALVTREFPLDDPARRGFVDLVRGCDAAFVNLESPLNDFAGHPAPDTGIHLSSSAAAGRVLLDAGFTLFSAANNHALDYGVEGLRAHVAAMLQLGMAYAGVGETAAEAVRPVYRRTANGTVALVACASSLGPGWPAADPSNGVAGRPGVCALGFETVYTLDPDRFGRLDEIAEVLGFGRDERYHEAMGYRPPLGDGALRFGGAVIRPGPAPAVSSQAVPADVRRICAAVAEARDRADVVIVSLHTQEYGSDITEPAAFVADFARQCARAGATVLVASGPHVLRGVEVIDDMPVFHSLGNLWFEYEFLDRLPADSMRPYGLPLDSNPAHFARHAMTGFQTDKRHWQTVLPVCAVRDGRVAEMSIYPIECGHQESTQRRGRPRVATGAAGDQVLTAFDELCRGYGVRVDASADPARLRW